MKWKASDAFLGFNKILPAIFTISLEDMMIFTHEVTSSLVHVHYSIHDDKHINLNVFFSLSTIFFF